MPTGIEQEPWERRESALLRFLPIALLAVSTVITVMQPEHLRAGLPVTLAVIGAATAWVVGLDLINPAWKADRRTLAVIYYVGLLTFVAVLITLAPWFGIFGFAGYIRAFDCLAGLWRLAGVAATAPLMALSQIGGFEGVRVAGLPSFAILVGLNLGLAGAFSYFGWHTVERDRKRKETVEELEKANAKLAAALEENAGLHNQLLVQAREAGMLDERQRMAREIHDTLAQGLAGIITQLEAAEVNPVAWRRHLDNAVGLARESLTEARRSVHAVRPQALENARLPDALADVARRWSEINGVPAEVTTTGTARPMHPDVEVTLLRTAQEALANVAKHAGASRVGITLSYMEDMVTLDVRDDGTGFTVPSNGSGNGGFGLTSMRQRVDGLSGRLEIESEPGAGTAVSAIIPTGA